MKTKSFLVRDAVFIGKYFPTFRRRFLYYDYFEDGCKKWDPSCSTPYSQRCTRFVDILACFVCLDVTEIMQKYMCYACVLQTEELNV